MKKLLFLAGIFAMSTAMFGQSKEIRKATRAIDKGDVAEAMEYVKEAEGMMASADEEDKVDFYLVKGEVYLADAGDSNYAKMKTAAESFKMAYEMNPSDEEAKARLDAGLQNLRAALVNSAVADQNSQQYKMAADKLYTSYMVTQRDTSDLYYAANNAVNAKDYDQALGYFQTLYELGFTGIRKRLVATNVETGEEDEFNNENERKMSVLAKQHTNPKEVYSESLRGDILSKITLILISQGKDNEALAMMKEARAENPDDTGLIRAEADLAYKMGDMERYGELMEEVIASDPNNPELYYNLGVGTAQRGETDKAMEYYKKALELDPNYLNAKINVAALILSKESAIVEEMNNLGTSAADNKRYDELKEQRKQLYMQATPYLEAAVAQRGDNPELVRTLMNIYSQLGQDDKFKEMKAKLDSLEGGK
ncbi:tetratricopeptide repeat protein [Altibacter sp. HG106]|uniref:tetratricopeptide repeat protein n=1 Tax=Altibacter sp. HG106 TaxID=3023937 RepID=UPI00235087F6|nr:tetratricopeptide repeat protein [Altibacter sp. HG106]MDC7996239.1 tetratricopeptide repeat protein [Altibacter sp. HG106]